MKRWGRIGLVAIWVALAAGCRPPALAPAQPLSGSAPPSPTAAPACVDPILDARERLKIGPAVTLERDANPPDLDGDGQPDVIVVEPGSREATHVLYVMTAGCARYVDRIEAFMLGCDQGRSHGLCDLWVETWLMHGDRLRTRWSFGGTVYRETGDSELVPGP